MADMKSEKAGMERAKELFYRYHGNRFYMDHDGAGTEYESFHISRETEEEWADELISLLLDGEPAGREAQRLYSAVSDMTGRDSRPEEWDACLYYPLRDARLDDVTVLFLLSFSFRMAEKAVRKGLFSREEAEKYLRELDRSCRQLQTRADSGTLTRSPDYVMREFSDPVYVADYLGEMKKKWESLFR